MEHQTTDALATILRLLTTQAEETAKLREQVNQIGAQLQWSGQETARRLVSELLKQASSGSRAAVIAAKE